MHVAHVEAGALPPQAARPERRQGALVAQLGQRVGLFHELRKLARAEELSHGGDHGTDVDQRDRRKLILVTDRHALENDTLHAAQADTQLGLDQFTNRLHPAIAEVVDVIRLLHAVVDQDQSLDEAVDIPPSHLPMFEGNGVTQLELLVELVAPHPFQVVTARVEQLLVEILAGIVQELADRRGAFDGRTRSTLLRQASGLL